MPNPDNPILVEWIDSAQPISAWMFLEKKPRLEIIQCVSVGWVVGETDEVLMLAPNLGIRGTVTLLVAIDAKEYYSPFARTV
jgi:hypothetical protein